MRLMVSVVSPVALFLGYAGWKLNSDGSIASATDQKTAWRRAQRFQSIGRVVVASPMAPSRPSLRKAQNGPSAGRVRNDAGPISMVIQLGRQSHGALFTSTRDTIAWSSAYRSTQAMR